MLRLREDVIIIAVFLFFLFLFFASAFRFSTCFVVKYPPFVYRIPRNGMTKIQNKAAGVQCQGYGCMDPVLSGSREKCRSAQEHELTRRSRLQIAIRPARPTIIISSCYNTCRSYWSVRARLCYRAKDTYKTKRKKNNKKSSML